MIKQKIKKSKIPKFTSYEEEANFWDTHDTTEFEDEFKPVKIEFAKPLGHILGVRLDAKTIDQLNNKGQEVGVGASTLARMWILEKLKSLEKKNSGGFKLSKRPASRAVLHKISK